MKFILEEEDRQEVLSVANRFDIDSDKLWEAYQKLMKTDFLEDLCNIARINNDLLKGE